MMILTNALAVQVFRTSNGPRYAAIDILRNLYLAIYIHDKLSATSSMQLYPMDWIELLCLSPWYLSITAMVPSLLWCPRSDLRSPECSDYCYKLRYSVVAPIAGNRHQSWSSCCLSSLISPVLLLPQHLSQRQLLQISSAATTPASGAVPAVYTTVEDTAVVIAGTINNLDLSDASKLLLLYFSLLQYL